MPRSPVAAGLLAAGLLSATPVVHAQTCQARSGATPPTVVELYTSEGCSSCPPADRWLSSLKTTDTSKEVLALAFHVTYWDRLGWPDRFASAEYTARQYELAQRAGSRQVYTPQVVVDGQDWRHWPSLPAPRTAAAGPSLMLERQGDRVVAQVSGLSQGSPQLAGYWAVLEDRHQSRVTAGENSGATLRHDHVVRLYKPVPAWTAGAGTSQSLNVSRGVPEHPRRVAFVVTDAATGRPVQALALAC